jgi:hypothetical protein
MPELSPEERERIYQEEKARKEAQGRIKQEESAKAMKTGCLGCLGIIVLVVVIGAVASLFNSGDTTTRSTSNTTTNPAPTPTPPATPPLQLLSARGTIDSDVGYNTVKGQVKNISGAPLRNVEAVVSWYDNNGNFISSDSALIEYNPLLAGQTSPFEVLTRTNPAMKRFGTEFKTVLGGTINFEDKTKKK